MFGHHPGFSPVPQEYIWVANYYNGYLSEFDFETKKDNDFYSIKKEKLAQFGLLGSGRKLWFECHGGSFNILGKNYNIRLKVNGKYFNFTHSNEHRNDIITFKKAYSDVSTGRQGILNSNISSYSFGYKTELNFKDIKFNFKPIITLIHGKRDIYMNLSICCNKKINCLVELVNNDKIIKSIEAKILPNIYGEITFKLE